ncbi:hypothetical protein DE146DRAFT_477261 [Phaeosphaeria sp. MPI-PUGE-AT-0046c]|nr:hypothetical protein DE146DRAFT_477261 [Phaeosphaeria sp. MPI-PUGE-AT-0046c]
MNVLAIGSTGCGLVNALGILIGPDGVSISADGRDGCYFPSHAFNTKTVRVVSRKGSSLSHTRPSTMECVRIDLAGLHRQPPERGKHGAVMSTAFDYTSLQLLGHGCLMLRQCG